MNPNQQDQQDTGRWWPDSRATAVADEPPTLPVIEVSKVAFDKVLVDPGMFTGMIFCASEEKKEYTKDRSVPNNAKAQAKTDDGVPKWSVTVQALTSADYGDEQRSASLKVTVPSHEDPAKSFSFGQPVQLGRLVYSFMRPRDEPNKVIFYWNASGISAVGGANLKAAAS